MYKVITDVKQGALEGVLNEHEQDGWLLVSTSVETRYYSQDYTLIFRQESPVRRHM